MTYGDSLRHREIKINNNKKEINSFGKNDKHKKKRTTINLILIGSVK